MKDKTIKGVSMGILTEDDFEDTEVYEPVAALKDAGAAILVTGSNSRRTYHRKSEMSFGNDAYRNL
jgi:putative intracellular protease/amidase